MYLGDMMTVFAAIAGPLLFARWWAKDHQFMPEGYFVKRAHRGEQMKITLHVGEDSDISVDAREIDSKGIGVLWRELSVTFIKLASGTDTTKSPAREAPLPPPPPEEPVPLPPSAAFVPPAAINLTPPPEPLAEPEYHPPDERVPAEQFFTPARGSGVHVPLFKPDEPVVLDLPPGETDEPEDVVPGLDYPADKVATPATKRDRMGLHRRPKAEGRQRAAMTRVRAATVVLVFAAVVLASSQVAMHGMSFFTFRGNGTGATQQGAAEFGGPGQPNQVVTDRVVTPDGTTLKVRALRSDKWTAIAQKDSGKWNTLALGANYRKVSSIADIKWNAGHGWKSKWIMVQLHAR